MKKPRKQNGLAAATLTFGRFLRDPQNVGALVPSSRFLARTMLNAVVWKEQVRIVEFGPGTGALTAEILKLLPRSGRYLGIDREASFIDLLQNRFPGHDFVHDTVANLLPLARKRGLLPVDHIISSLPFSVLPDEVTREVLDAAAEALAPGGTVTSFHYMSGGLLPPARRYRRAMAHRFGPLESLKVEMLNIPPAIVSTWRKKPGTDKREESAPNLKTGTGRKRA